MPHRLEELLRRLKLGIYTIATLYVLVGLVIAARAALSGDVVLALVGLLLVFGSLGAAYMLLRALPLGARLWQASETLDDVRRQLEAQHRRDRPTGPRPPAPAAPPGSHAGPSDSARPRDPSHSDDDPTDAASEEVRLMNLAAVGGGDPRRITAAILDRSRFPRLVTAFPEAAEFPLDTPGPGEAREPAPAQPAGAQLPAEWHQQWLATLQQRDLERCRALLANVVHILDPQLLAQLQVDLHALATSLHRDLCLTFRAAVHERDYEAALRIGEQLRTEYPETDAASDFEQLEPYLRRRRDAGQVETQRPTPARAAGDSQ